MLKLYLKGNLAMASFVRKLIPHMALLHHSLVGQSVVMWAKCRIHSHKAASWPDHFMSTADANVSLGVWIFYMGQQHLIV